MATSISAAGTIFFADLKPDCLATKIPGPWNHPCFLSVGPSLRPDEGLLMVNPFFLRRAAILDSASLGRGLVDSVAHVELTDGGGTGIGRDVGINRIRTIYDEIRGVRASAAGVRSH